jgi:hypothetical protein
MLRSVVWQKFTDVSEVLFASIFKAMGRLHGLTSRETVIFKQAAVIA